jgi:tRNA-Thr(GGU) m(6)t(6)A37 methyltransferase TsaA
MTNEAERAVTYHPIGHVENEIAKPLPPDSFHTVESRIVLDPALVEGLQGVTAGKQIVVVFHFHLSTDYELTQHPRGDQNRPKLGVFALRSPRRPNPIGITEVEVLDVEGNVLRVRGLDAINGTPVLDIKLV